MKLNTYVRTLKFWLLQVLRAQTPYARTTENNNNGKSRDMQVNSGKSRDIRGNCNANHVTCTPIVLSVEWKKWKWSKRLFWTKIRVSYSIIKGKLYFFSRFFHKYEKNEVSCCGRLTQGESNMTPWSSGWPCKGQFYVNDYCRRKPWEFVANPQSDSVDEAGKKREKTMNIEYIESRHIPSLERALTKKNKKNNRQGL